MEKSCIGRKQTFGCFKRMPFQAVAMISGRLSLLFLEFSPALFLGKTLNGSVFCFHLPVRESGKIPEKPILKSFAGGG